MGVYDEGSFQRGQPGRIISRQKDKLFRQSESLCELSAPAQSSATKPVRNSLTFSHVYR